MRVSWMSRVLSWVSAALVGGVYGIAGTIAHSLMWGPIPVGLIVGSVACAAILVAVRTLTHDRGAALAGGLGMIGMLLVISGVGPGGSVVVPDSVTGRIWTYVVAGIVLIVVAWPSFSRLPVATPTATAPAPDTGGPLITAVPLNPSTGPAVSTRPGSSQESDAREP